MVETISPRGGLELRISRPVLNPLSYDGVSNSAGPVQTAPLEAV